MDIHRHPEKIHEQLGPGGSQKYTMYIGYTMYPWISRDIPWMPCWFAVLYLYMYFGYTMDIQRCSMDALLVCYCTCTCTCTSDIHCIHGYPEIFNGCLVGLQYCTCTLYFGYIMDIQRYSMDALLVCTTVHVHVHVLQIYIVSMDIQRRMYFGPAV